MYCLLSVLLLASMAIKCNGAHTKKGQSQHRMNHRPLLSNIQSARKLLSGSPSQSNSLDGGHGGDVVRDAILTIAKQIGGADPNTFTLSFKGRALSPLLSMAVAGITAESDVVLIPLEPINMLMYAMRDTNFADIVRVEKDELLCEDDWEILKRYVTVTRMVTRDPRDDRNGDIQTIESFPPALDV